MSYMPIRSEAPLKSGPVNGRHHSLLASQVEHTSRVSRPPSQDEFLAHLDPEHLPIIVHSHLGWDWVWQRPQQFLSRLSQKRRILFVEMDIPDPQLAAPMARFRPVPEFPNLTVLRLQFPAWRWQDGQHVDAERCRLVSEFLNGPAAGQFDRPVQWFYDPMAFPAFVGKLGEVLTVYDCMDELSKFRFAPPEIVQREQQLLAHADVVFAGGRRLHEAKQRLNPNCHFYGCGVDTAHFGKARLPDTAIPPELAALPRPVYGYFGVVDERLDYGLIADLADANPEGSVVIVGPVVKVDAAALPQRPNLHWLGQRAYADLPAICKGFDVCLMPFALNESTEFINPTKTLEYMATARPIVSTAVPDVVRNFSSVVRVATNPGEFLALCADTARNPQPDTIRRGLALAAEHSWDSIVVKLEGHLREALLRRTHPVVA